MKFEFSPVSTVEVKHVTLMHQLDGQLNSFFQSKDYGEDLKAVQIGVIAVSPHLERFFKPQKPRYITHSKKQQHQPVNMLHDRALKYQINLNFQGFNNANETEASEMLKKELLSSISLFDRLKNKIKDFNVTLFRQDMKRFFEEVPV